MNKKELIEYIDQYLKPKGFRKKDKSWYKENEETITVFALDRSRWGEIYYVYLCVWFRGMSDEKRPRFYKCHSKLRAESLDENTEEYLNLEKSMVERERKRRILQLLNKSLSILEQEQTVEGFKKLLTKYNPRLFMVLTTVQEYLGVTIP